MTNEESSAPTPSLPTASNNSKSSDPGWKYCYRDPEDRSKIICIFCKKKTSGGITRLKDHLILKKGNTTGCPSCPKNVFEEIKKFQEDKARESFASLSSHSPLDVISEEEDEVGMTVTQNPQKKKGPMDLFCRNPEVAIRKKKEQQSKLRQASIRDACDKQLTANVHQLIARFWYQAGLSFNLIKLDSFKDMVTGIGSFGPNLRVPSYHEIRVPLLKKELEYTEDLLRDHKEKWRKHGCTIMSDGWTDRKQRSIINFLVNSSAGTMFLKSIDASDHVKTGQLIFELLDSVVEEVGEENVVQVISDNGSNYVAAGKLLEQKRPHLFWTPCAAHCIDLILEDIGKLPMIKKTIQRAISLVGFIYSHTSTLSMLRQFTNKRELVRPAITRFATSFLALERLHGEKRNLRTMFTSEEWSKNKLSKETKGKQATKTVLMPSFWNNVVYILKVMAPLVKVLRLVDGEKKPAMGYIYEAMDRVKDTIKKSFKNEEAKYKDVIALIDKRWECQLGRDLHAAAHLLNPEYYYSNPNLENDLKVNNGLYQCIMRLVRGEDQQTEILNELQYYKNAEGLFGCPFAVKGRKTTAPAQWWKNFGMEAKNLQPLAIKILSLTCSASGCERNWSVFEQIHTKKRNRLEHKKMHDLVFVKYNQQLKKRYNLKDSIDPIELNEIDACNEWLRGQMDDLEEEVGAENYLVFDDDPTLNWETVYEASGAKEIQRYTRRKANKRKASSSVGAATTTTKKGSNSTLQAKKRQAISKGKKKVVEEEEYEESSEEEEEEPIDFDKSEEEEEESEGVEEGEGYAPIDDNEDDYVGVSEDD